MVPGSGANVPITGGNSKVLWSGVRRIRNVPGSKRDTFFAAEDSPHSWKPLLKHSGTQRSPTMIWGEHGEFQCIGSCGQFWGFELVD